jgi:hypothetical protein
MPNDAQNPLLEKRLATAAWIGWIVFFSAVAILVAHNPMAHEDCHVYAAASHDWWAGQDVYGHNVRIDGFLYLPQFAILYTPFYLMGPLIGGLAWRAMAWILYATGMWRISKVLAPHHYLAIFALATAAAMPQGVASLRNGQANLHIAGLMLQTGAELSQRNWWRATFWLVAGVVIKPIMIVMLLLSAAVYRPLIPRLIVGVIFVALLPFATQRTDFVISEFRAYNDVLKVSSEPPNFYCNIRGLIGHMGLIAHLDWKMSQTTFKVMSLLAAGATLWLCLQGSWRRSESVRVYYLLGFAAVFLMLFNPRTESNSYVILAPIVALPAAVLVCILHRPRPAMWLYVLSFMLLCDGWAYKWTENWLKPLTCVIMWALLIRQLLRPPTDIELAPTLPPESTPQSLSIAPAAT